MRRPASVFSEYKVVNMYYTAKRCSTDPWSGTVPQRANQLGVRFNNSPFCARQTVRLYLAPSQKHVRCQRTRKRQALQHRVHKTRVAQVLKPNHAEVGVVQLRVCPFPHAWAWQCAPYVARLLCLPRTALLRRSRFRVSASASLIDPTSVSCGDAIAAAAAAITITTRDLVFAKSPVVVICTMASYVHPRTSCRVRVMSLWQRRVERR